MSDEKQLIFVGDKRCGKSSLIAKYLEEPVKDQMKETTGMEFKFGIKYQEDKKQKLSIYELGKNGILI